MSNFEYHTGKLIKTNETIQGHIDNEETVPKWLLAATDKERLEWFRDNFYRQKVLINGVIYNVDDTQQNDEEISIAAQDGDDINFTVRFYNGGCDLDDALERAVKQMNERG